MNNIYKLFYGILLISTITISSILLDMGNIATIAMVLNVGCVILVAMRHYAANMVGVFGAILYGIVSYNWGLYGEAGLNILYFAPLHLFAAFAWLYKRETINNTEQSSMVVVNSLSLRQWGLFLALLISLIIGINIVLSWLNGNLTIIDSITTSLSIVAMYLLVNRYREQWIFWIAVNIASIVMWLLVFFQNPVINQEAIGLMLMWSVFLINSIYGCYQWYKTIVPHY